MLPDMIMMYLYVVPITNKDVLENLPLASGNELILIIIEFNYLQISILSKSVTYK